MSEAGNPEDFTALPGALRPGPKGADLYIALCLALACFVLRLGAAYGLSLSADEGVVGIMALDILSGKAPTVYWYGQQYMGTIENILAAPFILLLGTQAISIRLPSVLGTALAVFLVYLYFVRRGARGAGFVSGMLLIVSPPFFHDITSRARGGYGVTLPLAAGMLLCCAGRGRLPFVRGLLLGLLAGVAFWTNPQTVEISLPLVIWVVLVRRSKAGMAGVAVGALVGLAPSLTHWAATGVFMNLPAGAAVSAGGLAVLLRRTAAFLGAGGGAPFAVAVVTAGLNGLFLGAGVLIYIVSRAREGGARALDALVATPFMGMAVLAASASAYPPQRYFYLVYFAAVLLAAAGWMRPGGLWAPLWRRRMGGAAVAVVFAANFLSLSLYHMGDPYGEEYFSRGEYDVVRQRLRAKGVIHLVTDYGADYALMYLTGLEVKALAVPLGGTWSTRYAEALETVPRARTFAVVLYEQPAHERLKSHMRPEVFDSWLGETGRSAEVCVFGRITLFFDISGMETAAGLEEYGRWALLRHSELEELIPAVHTGALFKDR